MNHLYIERFKIYSIERLEFNLKINLKAFFDEIVPKGNVIFIKVYIIFYDFEDKSLKIFLY